MSTRKTEPIQKVTLKDGTIRYRVVVDVGRKPNGARDQRTSTWKTLREARAHLATVRSGVSSGTYVKPDRVTLEAHAEQWLRGKRRIRDVTRKGYADALRPVLAMYGRRTIQSITKADLETLVDSMLATGGYQRNGRSKRTVQLALTVLAQCLDAAVKEGNLTRNVARLVEVGDRGASARKRTAWSRGDVERFRQHVEADRLYAGWLLTLPGLRRSDLRSAGCAGRTSTSTPERSRSTRAACGSTASRPTPTSPSPRGQLEPCPWATCRVLCPRSRRYIDSRRPNGSRLASATPIRVSCSWTSAAWRSGRSCGRVGSPGCRPPQAVRASRFTSAVTRS